MTTPILSRYRLEDKLGEGGMGIVYRASDLRLGRTVALKMLRPEMSANAALRQRLETEAHAASLLNHPSIATLFDFETDGDVAFLVYEYVNGKTLRDREIENPLELPDILSIFLKLAQGVAAAHDAGIIHRDLKPENVMITDDGRVKILDFGLAKVQTPDADGTSIPTTATAPGVLLGTVAYMSPEQLEGGAVDHRTDIFALGTMLYEFVAKRHPFKGKSSSSTIGNILKEEPGDLSRWGVRVPRELERVIKKSVRKNREERYQSVRDFASDIETVYQSLSGIGATSVAASEFVLPISRKLAKSLFLIIQFGYLTLYGAVFYHLDAVVRILSTDPFLYPEAAVTRTILLAAMCGVAVRLYLLTAIGFDHPDAGNKFRRLFPAILLLDGFWAASPLLLWMTIRWGVALGCAAVMAYLGFAQRTLIDSIHPDRTS